MTRILDLSLITLGDPRKLTGGYLYHQRIAGMAPRYGARLSFVSVPEHPFPFPIVAGGQVLSKALAARPAALLIDSIAAAYLAPTVLQQRVVVPLCGVLHQPPGGIDHGPLRARLQAGLDMIVYRRASLLIVASQMLAHEMRRRGIAAAQLKIVPPGRDLIAHVPQQASSLDLRRGGNASFLCVANWLARKGIHTLLDAFALVPAATLHLVGDNHIDLAYARRINRRLARPDLAGRVHVHGPLPSSAVADLYRAADVFVLPSSKEPYGTVYGEAMAAGLPVVGLDAGNLPCLITSGVEGLLAAPGDVHGLAEALNALAADEVLRRRMGEAARRRASTWPTWDESAAVFFEAVRELCSQNSPWGEGAGD